MGLLFPDRPEFKRGVLLPGASSRREPMDFRHERADFFAAVLEVPEDPTKDPTTIIGMSNPVPREGDVVILSRPAIIESDGRQANIGARYRIVEVTTETDHEFGWAALAMFVKRTQDELETDYRRMP